MCVQDMKKIFKHFRPAICSQKYIFFFTFFSLVAIVLIEVYLPFLFRDISELLSHSSPNAEEASHIFLMLLMAYGGVWIAWRVFEYFIVRFEVRGMYLLDIYCFEGIQRQSSRFFENSFSGSLVKKAAKFSRAFESIFDWILFVGFKNGFHILCTLLVFAIYKPFIAFLFLVWVISFVVGNMLFVFWKLPYDRKMSEAESRLGALYADAFSNMSSIKTFAMEKYEYRRTDEGAFDLFKKRYFSWLLQNINFGVQAAFMIGLELMIIFYILEGWKQGTMGIGDFVFFQAYLLVIFHHLWDFGRSLKNLSFAVADASEMVEIFENTVEVQDVLNAKKMSIKAGNISFQDISFSYDGEQSQFRNLSLDIPGGQSVAIVGHTGAGKTTITKLLFRFFDLQSGKICIDEQDISQMTQESLRKNISLVPQQPELFHRTIAENIAFGRSDMPYRDIREAAKKACALDFIEACPQGFDTVVGERGVKLSGGEKQRIAIARAFLENAPVLILDEATSALDSITEKKIQEAISRLIKNRTSIVIAHRLSTILQMDRIIVIENGMIIEDGSHAQLLEKNGVYADMWKHQSGDFLEDA
jgi:ATP-binding cassette subfamily B protein